MRAFLNPRWLPGGGQPLGSGRQLPPQLTVGRRPLGGGGGGGGGGGALEGGFREGRLGGGGSRRGLGGGGLREGRSIGHLRRPWTPGGDTFGN